MARLKNLLIDILFPPLCVHCGVYLTDSRLPLCDACLSSIVRNTALYCPICQARLATNDRVCNHGQKDRVRFPYALGTVTHYNDPIIRNIIHLCKYQKMHSLTDLCADLLIEYVDRLNPKPAMLDTYPLVIPIPLHPKKERVRGFNQSALIARTFARNKNFPYAELLIKLKNNDPQAQAKTHADRFHNISGGFAIFDPAAARDKNIILIDDVSTSGATLSEAAQVLKAAGAKQILALVIAKA